MKILIYALATLTLGCNACFLNKKVKQEKADQGKTDKLSAVAAGQQINMRSLASFENDTIAYLRTNIYQQKEFFIGKKLEVLLDSLEIDVQNYFIGDNFNQPDSSKDAMLFFTDMTTIFLNKKEKKYKQLSIDFKQQVSFNKAFSLMRKTNSKWTEEAYTFHKDRIIEDIGMIDSK